jgi:hypothetical protein
MDKTQYQKGIMHGIIIGLGLCLASFYIVFVKKREK